MIAERQITPPMVQQQQQLPVPPAPLAENNNPIRELNDIRTIFGGPETGDSSCARKSYAREAKDFDGTQYVNMTEHIAKFSKMDNVAITFIEEEAKKLLHPRNDALVISLRIANSWVHRILVDNGSSADIRFKSALTRINLGGRS